MEELNGAITRPWRLAQEIVICLTKAEKSLGGIVVSLMHSAQWTDGIVFIESKRCGRAWCSNKLKEVFACLEGLKESYRPLIDFFNLQEVHLRLLQERVFDDFESQMAALQTDPTVSGLALPSPPVMPFPFENVREQGVATVVDWRAFSPNSDIFTKLYTVRTQIIENIRAGSTLEDDCERRVSDKLRVAFSRFSFLPTSSSVINAY